MPALAAYAIAAVASAAIGAGTSLYQGSQQKKAASQASAQQMKLGAQQSKYLKGYVDKIKWRDVAPPERVDPFAIADRAYTTNLDRALNIIKKGDELGRARTAEFGARLEELVPGAKGLIAESMKNIGEQMRGELPSDVRKQLALTATAQAGKGGRSTAARNISLASLGGSSIEAQRYANEASLKLMSPFMNAASDMSALSPAMMQYTLMSPAQFYEASNQQAMNQYNARLNNAQQRMAAAVSRYNAAAGVSQTALGNSIGALNTQLAGQLGSAASIGAAGSQITQALGWWAGTRSNLGGGGSGAGGAAPAPQQNFYPAPYQPSTRARLG